MTATPITDEEIAAFGPCAYRDCTYCRLVARIRAQSAEIAALRAVAEAARRARRAREEVDQ